MLAYLVLLFAADGPSPRQALLDVQDHLESKLPKLPTFDRPADWQRYADKLRQDVLDRVVFRGEATAWRKAKAKPVYGDTLKGDGYSIRKLRYEALPGMWIPALLYTPDGVKGKVPVMLAVNGHDRNGKAAAYKQVRCINLAKRGLVVLNLEWFGMGQLRVPGFEHGAMNQLDLCGTSGLAPFYLAMARGLDVLLAHPNADPKRVCVSGLSGGGWQTIVISSLDTRVTLANPVAGYSSFKVRLRDHFKDLGDSEQTPVDLATLADYTHLTALLAPRAALLTYNAKDNCCFEAGYALPPLLAAARPVYKLLDRPDGIRSHVNHVPGDHNFLQENREALYKAVGDYFFPGDAAFKPAEIDVTKEVRKADELHVDLPKGNATFNSEALRLAKALPRDGALPTDAEKAKAWQKDRRKALAAALRRPDLKVSKEGKGGVRLSGKWTVPVRVHDTEGATKTALLLNDAGFAADKGTVARLQKDGYRVVALDPWYFGANRVASHDWLFALLVSCVGDRPLGLQAAQVEAVARWAAKTPAHVVAVGPRTSLIALAAAAGDGSAIGSLELVGSRASLKELIEENRPVSQVPEAFCFGLLEAADVAQMAALVAPRPVRFTEAKERHRSELKGLAAWYALLGRPHDPLK